MAEAVVTGTLSDTTVNGSLKFTQEGDGKIKMDLELNIPQWRIIQWLCIYMNMGIAAMPEKLQADTGTLPINNMANGALENFILVT